MDVALVLADPELAAHLGAVVRQPAALRSRDDAAERVDLRDQMPASDVSFEPESGCATLQLSR